MNILIAGDSFAADWTVKYPNKQGWPNMLSSAYNVLNVAEAGVSEYKILKQLEHISDISIFDCVIVSHTCFSRVHTIRHPFLHNDPLHYNCDLILSDVYNKQKANESMKAAWGYFKYHWDITYYRDIYNLFRDKIDKVVSDVSNVIHINNFEPLQTDISYRHLLADYSGDINHFTDKGNCIIYQDILNRILH